MTVYIEYLPFAFGLHTPPYGSWVVFSFSCWSLVFVTTVPFLLSQLIWQMTLTDESSGRDFEANYEVVYLESLSRFLSSLWSLLLASREITLLGFALVSFFVWNLFNFQGKNNKTKQQQQQQQQQQQNQVEQKYNNTSGGTKI